MVHKIKELCKKKGISLAELERQVGVSNKGIYRWDEQSPSVDRVYRAAKVLGVTVEELIEG